MLILKPRSRSSRWYKATSWSLARSSSDRLWIGTGCNLTLWPNMVAHVWSPCHEKREGLAVADVDSINHSVRLLGFLSMFPLRETKVPNKSEAGDPDPPPLTKGRSNHRLTRTRQIPPISSSEACFTRAAAITQKCTLNIRPCRLFGWWEQSGRTSSTNYRHKVWRTTQTNTQRFPK